MLDVASLIASLARTPLAQACLAHDFFSLKYDDTQSGSSQSFVENPFPIFFLFCGAAAGRVAGVSRVWLCPLSCLLIDSVRDTSLRRWLYPLRGGSAAQPAPSRRARVRCSLATPCSPRLHPTFPGDVADCRIVDTFTRAASLTTFNHGKGTPERNPRWPQAEEPPPQEPVVGRCVQEVEQRCGDAREPARRCLDGQGHCRREDRH